MFDRLDHRVHLPGPYLFCKAKGEAFGRVKGNMRREALASDHKYLRICDLCQELGIIAARCIIAVERERQAKTDACLVPLCPLARPYPKRGNGLSVVSWWVARRAQFIVPPHL